MITKSPAQGMQCVKQQGCERGAFRYQSPGLNQASLGTADPGLHSTAREALPRMWRGGGCSPRLGLVFETGTDPCNLRLSLASTLICRLLSEVHVLKLPMNYQTNSPWLLKSPIQ